MHAWARPNWQRRFARADQYLRDAGVFYRVYDGAGATERAWPLAHIPLLIDETEWADHFHRPRCSAPNCSKTIVADIYGDNRLVAEGAAAA